MFARQGLNGKGKAGIIRMIPAMVYLARISHRLLVFSGLFARLLRSGRYLSSTYIRKGLRKITSYLNFS